MVTGGAQDLDGGLPFVLCAFKWRVSRLPWADGQSNLAFLYGLDKACVLVMRGLHFLIFPPTPRVPHDAAVNPLAARAGRPEATVLRAEVVLNFALTH